MSAATKPPRRPKAPAGCYWRGDVLWARFKVRGAEYRVSCRTGTPSVAAKRRERERQAVIDETIYGEAGPVGWPAAVLEWTSNPPGNVTLSTLRRYASSLLMVGEHLNHLSVQQVTGDVLRGIIAARRKVASNRTVQRDMTAISSVLDAAIDRGWIKENVAHTLDRRKIRSPRHKIVLPSAADIEAVIAECPPALGALARFAWQTGLRINEAVSLRRVDADARRAQATIYFGSKGDKVRTIDLSRSALATAKRQPARIDCPNLFWNADGEALKNASSRFSREVARVARKAAREGREFRPFRFHDLRHAFAVDELKSGRMGLYALRQHLGHDSVKTTEIYLAFLTADEADQARRGGGTLRGTGAAVRAAPTGGKLLKGGA